VRTVAVTPDGQKVVTGSADRTVKVWEMASGRLLRTLEGHKDTVYAVAVFPDGRSIVTGSADRTVRIWALDDAPSAKR
jgi:WD40 repeat protein